MLPQAAPAPRWTNTSKPIRNWIYTLALPVVGRVWHVQFDDWMYLMDERVMLNKASMRKFGIFLGEVTLSFSKRA